MERTVDQLHLLCSKEPQPTVEVLSDGVDVAEVLKPALARFAGAHPDQRGTIYLYGAMSTNFHEQAWSEFLIVNGSQQLLQVVRSAYSGCKGVRTRFGEGIRPAQGQALFHLEDGVCWQVLDPATWFSVEPAAESSAPAESQLKPTPLGDEVEDAALLRGKKASDAWPFGDDDEELEQDEQHVVGDYAEIPGRRGRLRAARADASVGTIRRTIERVFGLPTGSVALCGPDRRPLRSDATIGTLRKRWDEA